MKMKVILILIFLIIPSSAALFKPGFFGASDDMHIAWLSQLDKTIQMGKIPPRYVPDLSYGFGYPLFNFIFPLPYYLAEVVHINGVSLVDSIKFVFAFSLFASGLTMYILVKHISNDVTAMAAAVLYVYTPYRATDIYIRGALGESLSFVFLPLIVYSIIRLSKELEIKRSLLWMAIGGLAISGLILTHNIVSYMFIPLAFVLGLLLMSKNILKLALLFITGLLGSIYFWLPALIDSKLMKYETVFNFVDHFPTIKQLIIPYWGYGASVAGPFDGMSFFIGEINILITFVALILIFSRLVRNSFLWKRIVLWTIFVIFTSIFMMNFRSTIVWDNLPLIAYFQFPWRFLTLVTFGTSILVVVINRFAFYKYLAIFIIILTIGLNYNRFKPQDYLLRNDNYYLNRYIPVPTPSAEYNNLEEEYLRLPKNTIERPKTVYPRLYPLSKYIIKSDFHNSLDATFTTDYPDNTTLNYNKYYFPGWTGMVDDKEIILSAGKPYGQIQFTVPKGLHKVSISFNETMFNRIIDGVSLVVCLLCFIIIFYVNFFYRKKQYYNNT